MNDQDDVRKYTGRSRDGGYKRGERQTIVTAMLPATIDANTTVHSTISKRYQVLILSTLTLGALRCDSP